MDTTNRQSGLRSGEGTGWDGRAMRKMRRKRTDLPTIPPLCLILHKTYLSGKFLIHSGHCSILNWDHSVTVLVFFFFFFFTPIS